MHRKPTGLILCGGSATRLGGIDKPLRHFNRQPLLEHVIARLLSQVSNIVISANRSIDAYAGLGFAVVGDAAHGGRGPLAGVLAGLALADADLLCVPGDAPAIPLDLGARLAEARGNAGIAYANDGDGPQPLCCLLRANLQADLRTYLDSGGSTPREWFARHHGVAVDFSGTPPWSWSINTADEWAFAEAQAEKHLETRLETPAPGQTDSR